MSVSGVCDHRCVHVFIDPDGHNVEAVHHGERDGTP
jgi:hypothetical protein